MQHLSDLKMVAKVLKRQFIQIIYISSCMYIAGFYIPMINDYTSDTFTMASHWRI